MAKNKINKAWLNRHVNDHYVHLANKDGYRSRAAYKLLELDNGVNLFKNINIVVDLGCTPGSWSQVLVNKIKPINSKAQIIGLDILDMEPINGVTFIQGDFTEDLVLNKLISALGGSETELIVSDIAPEFSGIKNVDQSKSAYLVELVFLFAKDHLKQNGNLVVKVFQGGEFDNLLKIARGMFKQVQVKKPSASRSESPEMYLVCKIKL